VGTDLVLRCSGELPGEVDGFVGRRRELAQLASQLRVVRLVTVTGPGGVGKTRVALRVAAKLASRFLDGVCLVELSSLRDPELVPNVVAASLGLPETEVGSQLVAVLDYLRGREQLLVLDTCEHLLDACATFADALLRGAPGVTLLVTSRQRLGVPGEHVCVIPPLPVPEADAEQAGTGDAVQLLEQRAAAVVPGFAVTGANRADVIRLCRRLDGIPLAIELAAVLLRAISLGELVQRLEDRFGLLAGRRGGAVPQHQTLQDATLWSYDLCTQAEQLLWARLSVFAGSFDLIAVRQVCAGDSLAEEMVTRALIGLVDKSVVLRVEGDDTRYRLLDTISSFGAGLLAASGERSAVRDRHIAHYLAMAGDFSDHAKSGEQLNRFQATRREHSNIRAAIEYALAEPGRAPSAAKLATDLRAYWEISGLLREGRHWLTRVLGCFPDPSPERAQLLMARGALATLQGETADAIADLELCIPMAELHREPVACALGYAYLNPAFTFTGRHAEAAATAVVAEQRLLALDHFGGLVSLDIHMGYLHLLTGELDLAIDRCARGLDRLGDNGERWARGYLQVIIGTALYFRGENEASAAATSKALEMKYDLGDTVGMAYCLEALALLATARQRHERAVWLLGAADTLWERAGRRLGGNAILEQLHDGAAKAARDGLGEQRFDALWQEASRHPLGEIVSLAIRDAEAAGPKQPAHTLTSRERQIAALVSNGLSNRQIAGQLVISSRTVDAHVQHILTKLGFSSRVQIARWHSDTQRPLTAASKLRPRRKRVMMPDPAAQPRPATRRELA
jgi:predicted ATPase/DNA-binding CsgD family transcriptional regulator